MDEPVPAPDPAALLAWVERVAGFFAENYGLPPITGRVLGWLLVCEPAEQSAGDIAAAIGASRASLTTTMRFLTGSGLVHRLTRRGGNTTYYRIDDEVWEALVRRRIASLVSFGRITGDGLALLGPDAARSGRLRSAHDFFDWMAQVLAQSAPRRPT